MDAIAIIGVGCRFPGAADPEAYWQLLRNGVDAISEVPAGRWDVDRFYDADPAAPGSMSTRWGGFLEDVSGFDPAFFGISLAEAVAMDPQQRLMLELAYETLEDAGLPSERLAGSRTGVYTAFGMVEYCLPIYARPWQVGAYTNTGNIPCLIANRISYLLDLRGPSLALDSACSSSLIAVHLACQALRSAECELAFAGGVNLMLSPGFTIGYSKLNAMSPTGRCHSFAASADGYVRGEGAGLVLLKPLAAALEHGDRVRAVIHGSAINQDGRTNGLTAPNRFSQQDVLSRAYGAAGVAPAAVQYIEAHGTGTLLGDPIEAQALGAVLSPGRPRSRPCAIGSVKTNIGHLEPAAGVAGLIKVVLAIDHGELPPSLHFDAPNPNIPFESLGLQVQSTLEPWCARPRLCGVSGFGLGGSNAHLVVGEPPAASDAVDAPPGADPSHHVLPLSAHSPEALHALVARYRARVAGGDDVADLCYNAALHRSQRDWRAAFVAATRDALIERMNADPRAARAPSVFRGRRRAGRRVKVAFLFSGQGVQYPGMGKQLFDIQPEFRAALRHCSELAGEMDAGETDGGDLGRRTLLSVLFEEPSCLHETRFTQPALFALQYALTRMWAALGVVPDVVLGHSVGEYAAACAAGMVGLEDGLRLVIERARLMHALPERGAMAAVSAGADAVTSVLALPRDDLDIAAINAADETVISGRSAAVDDGLRRLQQAGVTARRLKVSHAFHSPLMEPVLDPLRALARGIEFHPPEVALVSNLTGTIRNEPLDGDYLARHARSPVRFLDCAKALVERGAGVFVEIGPHPVLGPLIQRAAPGKGGCRVSSLHRDRSDARSLAESVAGAFSAGLDIDWRPLHAGRPRRRLTLPLYPFQRIRLWHDNAPGPQQYSLGHDREGIGDAPVPQARHPDAPPDRSPFALRALDSPAPAFESTLTAREACASRPLTDADWSMLALAAHWLRGEARTESALTLSELRFGAPLAPCQGERHTLHVMLPQGSSGKFSVHSKQAGRTPSTWQRRASGQLSPGAEPTNGGPPLGDLKVRLRGRVEADDFYVELAAAGQAMAPAKRWLHGLRRGRAEVLADYELPGPDTGAEAFAHLLTSALCMCVHAVPLDRRDDQQLAVPARLLSLHWHGAPPAAGHLHAALLPTASSAGEVVLRIFDPAGRVRVRMTCALSPSPAPALGAAAATNDSVSADELRRRLRGARPAMRLDLVQTYLAGLVAEALAVPASDLDPDESVYRLGLDSLQIASLRERIERELNVAILTESLVDDDLSAATLANQLVRSMQHGDR